MATKTLTITEQAYESIKGLKRKEESFSQLFLRLSGSRDIGEKYFGVLKGDVEKRKKEIRKIREEVSRDFERRQNEFTRHFSRS